MSNRFDVIKENLRIDIFSFVANRDVQMFPSAAPRAAGNADHRSCLDHLP